MAEDTLRVCPNPYKFVDADGTPMGVFPEDPEYAGGTRRWVGASLCPVRTKITQERDPHTERAHKQTTCFVFDMGPHERPATPHYLQGIRTGDLLAADLETARLAGLPEDPKTAEAMGLPMWATPEKVLEREKAAAHARHRAHRGKDAQLGEPPRPLGPKGAEAKPAATEGGK